MICRWLESMDLCIVWRADEAPTEAVTSPPLVVFLASYFGDRGAR
jgi:hypothetical protein